jgi:DNA-binding MarR family transcriptional regulator
MIIRAPRPEAHFVMVRNSVARDERLSFRARGVLVAVLSRPDDWSISAENLAREGNEGVQTIYRALKELEAAGYVERRKVRNKAGQVRTETLVYDEPKDKTVQPAYQKPVSGEPSDGEPLPGETGSRFSVSDTKTELQKQNTKKENEYLATANAIAREWWEAQTDRPLTPFMALVKIVERALKAGYEADRVQRALASFAVVPSASQLEKQMKGIVYGAKRTDDRTAELARRAFAAAEEYQREQQAIRDNEGWDSDEV